MNLSESEKHQIRELLINIQMSLSSCNNTITTDDMSVTEDETHWRIKHDARIEEVNDIANLLGINLGSSPRCKHDSNSL